jgi:hypothetical protein
MVLLAEECITIVFPLESAGKSDQGELAGFAALPVGLSPFPATL